MCYHMNARRPDSTEITKHPGNTFFLCLIFTTLDQKTSGVLGKTDHAPPTTHMHHNISSQIQEAFQMLY